MNRTQIYLSEPQQRALSALAKQRRTTASALIRAAIDGYLVAQLTPSERVDALRGLALRFGSTEEVVEADSEGVSIVDSLRAADSERLNSRT
jgi:hypothetical protein